MAWIQVYDVSMTTTAVVHGQRTISWRPALDPEKRWEGTIDHEEYRERVWQQPTIERAIRAMDDELGAVDETRYVIAE